MMKVRKKRDLHPVPEDFVEVLGDDPTKSKAQVLRLNSNIQKRWKFWFDNGIDEKVQAELLEKYPSLEGLKVPETNEEFKIRLSKRAKERDDHVTSRQKLISSALAVLGDVMTTIMEEKDGVDPVELVDKLNDAGKMMVHCMHGQTISRRAILMAGTDKTIRATLEKANPGEELFGPNLAEKMEESKKLQQAASILSFKKAPYYQSRPPFINQSLNFRSLSGTRPFPYQPGYQAVRFQAPQAIRPPYNQTPPAPFQARRLVFRHRVPNQSFNPRAPPPFKKFRGGRH